MKNGLERNVLQAAISARQCLNGKIDVDLEVACYEMLKDCEKVSYLLKSGDAPFIRRMRETYEQEKGRKDDDPDQYRLFDGEC